MGGVIRLFAGVPEMRRLNLAMRTLTAGTQATAAPGLSA